MSSFAHILNLYRRHIVLLYLVFAFSACGVLGSGDLNNVVAMGAKKRQMLQERIDRFNQAMYWGDATLAVSFVSSDIRQDIYNRAKASRQTEHYVDLSVEDLKYEPEAESAEAVIGVKYYRTPNYTIRQRTEKQKWVFDRFGGGWLLQNLAVVEGTDVVQTNS